MHHLRMKKKITGCFGGLTSYTQNKRETEREEEEMVGGGDKETGNQMDVRE